jgi:hypothetical protein
MTRDSLFDAEILQRSKLNLKQLMNVEIYFGDVSGEEYDQIFHGGPLQ